MTGESGAEHHRRTRVVLTTKIKRAICEAIGACEYCGESHPPEELDVLPIGMLSSSPDRPYENPANALIVLCREHYRQAKEGTLGKTVLKAKVTKRSDKKRRPYGGSCRNSIAPMMAQMSTGTATRWFSGSGHL